MTIQTLTFTSLYPNEIVPNHGIFVERRLRHLLQSREVEASVIAPVPWFPFTAGVFGRYAAMARIASSADRFGISVRYPRYPHIPKIGMSVSPYLMAMATRSCVRRECAAAGAKLIDAHYFFPDGVAASLLARTLGLPYIITARGSDINLIARYSGPRKLMLRAAAGAAALVAVSKSLAAEMVRIGIPANKIRVLRNGVDLDRFHPISPAPGTPGVSGAPQFLSVGALKAAKGHDIAIRFVASVETARLVVAGEGPEKRRLKRLSDNLGVTERVHFVGALDAESLRVRYQTADALILMSKREGMPNVVLESLACGTPVLATNVGGIPEIINNESAGVLVTEHSAEALAAAWMKLRDRKISRVVVRRYAERFSWDDTVAGLVQLMHDCVRNHALETGTVSHNSQ